MKTTHKNKEVLDHFTNAVKTATPTELEALDKKLDRHYNNGTLEISDYRRLTLAIFERLCKFDCLT